MYHVSDLKKFNRCHRLFYYETQKEKEPFLPFLRSDESLTDLLIERLEINSFFRGQMGDDPALFFENYDKYNWFINSRMEVNGLRIRIPVLHKLDDGNFNAYFVYYGTHIKDLDFFSLRVQYSALSDLNINVKEIYYVYINPDYVFHNKHNVKKLFIITPYYNKTRFINLVVNDKIAYNNIIEEMNNNTLNNYSPIKCKSCRMMKMCPYYYDCFKDEADVEDDSILTLVSSANKRKMYDMGIRKLKDADVGMIEGNKVQYAQIMASKNGGLFYDTYSLQYWLKQIKKPLSYIDFEWDRYLIPAYENMKPLDVIPFEYALYIEKEDGELENRNFLSTGDCRKEFIESLIKDLPKEGSILAYNATGAECLRLKELIREFPQYKKELESIIARFVDLAVPFVEGIVYDTRMAGNFSLKKLVDILSEKSYSELDINEGMKAVYSWRHIDKDLNDDLNKTIEDLKEYCSLDAYGLVIVYRWLNNIEK